MKTKWSLFFDLSLFSPLKITFKQSGGHFEFFRWPFWFFFAESLSTHKAVETKWSLLFDLSLFSSLKITFNQSCGHFKLFWWPFWFLFVAESLSTHKAVETKWSLFFDLSRFSPLKITLKQFGGLLNFSGSHFDLFFCRIFIYPQSCGNKVVFVFFIYPFFAARGPSSSP